MKWKGKKNQEHITVETIPKSNCLIVETNTKLILLLHKYVTAHLSYLAQVLQ